MFRLSVKQDYPDLCGLWLEAFGEGEESAKFVFEGFSGYQHIYVLEEERAVVCMACAVPCSLQGKEGIYLYGVATKKSHRGKGRRNSSGLSGQRLSPNSRRYGKVLRHTSQ